MVRDGGEKILIVIVIVIVIVQMISTRRVQRSSSIIGKTVAITAMARVDKESQSRMKEDRETQPPHSSCTVVRHQRSR